MQSWTPSRPATVHAMKTFVLAQIDKLIARARKQILSKELDSYDIIEMAFIKAGLDSASYYEENMLTAEKFDSDLDLLAFALTIAPKNGIALEFGVATGRTISHIAK